MRLGYVDEIRVQHNAMPSLAVLLHQLHTNPRTYISIVERAGENVFKQYLKKGGAFGLPSLVHH